MKGEITTKEFTILAVAFVLLAIASVVSFFIPPVGQISNIICILLLPFLYFGIKCTITFYKEILSKNIKAMVYTIQEKKGDKIFVKIIAEHTTKAPEGAFVMVDDAKDEEIGQIISNLSTGYRTMYGEKAVILTEIR